MATRPESAAALKSQRRFLIIISLVVAAYYALAVHLKGEGEYSGLAVIINRPDRVPVALWIIFAWALLRYVQRLHEQWRFVGKAIMREVERCDDELVLKAAQHSAVRQVKDGRIGGKLTRPRVIGDVWVTDTVKEMMREVMAKRALAQGKSPPPREPDPWFTIDENGERAYRAFGIGVASRTSLRHRLGVIDHAAVSRAHTLRHQLRSWGRASLRLPAIFEYVAPLLIAVAAVVLAVVFRGR